MVSSRFFKPKRSFTLGEIANIAQASLMCEDDASFEINNIASLDEAKAEYISFLDNKKYVTQFKKTRASACIISKKHIPYAPKDTKLIISENPYYAYALVTAAFYPSLGNSDISERAYISPSATIGKNCTIQAGAFIGDSVTIGDNCFIATNSCISYAEIGNNCIIHAGVKIGQDGFGFAFTGSSHYKVPQLGSVIVEEFVEIGANTCIDRGSGPNTIIGEGTKIDNLVQIAHNCTIGKHCIIVANVAIAGSATLEDFVVIGGQSGVVGHVTVGKGAQIAGQSGVTKNIKAGEIVCGRPAIPIKKFQKQQIALKKLAERK